MGGFETTRRGLLRGAGAAGIGAALLGCKGEDPFAPHKPPVPGSENWATGEERFIATSCGQCDAGCGIRIRVVEGRAVKVEGNTTCPVNQGGVGPRGLAAPQVLYDPDRIRGPLQLVGPRGSGEWKEISWEESIALVSERLGKLRDAGTPERTAVLCGHERGFMLEIWNRFAQAIGTPNLLDGRGLVDGALAKAMKSMQGIEELPAYDWERAHLVLSLGSGMLDASCQMLHFVRARGRHRGGEGRARILHVGPALSRTAMNADEWVKALPGVNAAFALGLCHVLVRDGLYDTEFIDEHCSGFDAWEDPDGTQHIGFKDLLDEYTPERVGEICGVDPKVIERIAEQMSANGPCFAISGMDELRGSNGVQTAMAVHALNALLGAIDRPGGLLVQHAPPLAEWPEVEPDEIAEAGLERDPLVAAGPRSPWDALPEIHAQTEDGSLDTLLLHETNPVYERANHDGWEKFLSSVPFVVSFSSVFDETNSNFADLILPDHSWLERWEDSCAAPGQGRAVFGLRQPVVEPLYDTRPTGDVLISIAMELGEGVEEALPWKDFQSAFKKRVVGLYKAKAGSIVESKGSTFLKRLYSEGYWSDDSYEFEEWDRVIRTESGRFEFFSADLRESLKSRAAIYGISLEELAVELGAGEQVDRLFLPDYRELVTLGDEARFPHLLVPFRRGTHTEKNGAGLPWLTELAPWKGRATWATEVEIHPDTAARSGIEHGDVIVVESANGALEGFAYLTQGLLPGVVRIPHGGGHTAGNRYATGWGANVMDLLSSEGLDPLGGASPTQGARVSIRKVKA